MGFSTFPAASTSTEPLTDRGSSVVSTYYNSGSSFYITKPTFIAGYKFFIHIKFDKTSSVDLWSHNQQMVLLYPMLSASGTAGSSTTIEITEASFGSSAGLFVEGDFSGTLFIEKTKQTQLASITSTTLTPSTISGATFTDQYYTYYPSGWDSLAKRPVQFDGKPWFFLGNEKSTAKRLCTIPNPANPVISVVGNESLQVYWSISKMISNDDYLIYTYSDGYYGTNSTMKRSKTGVVNGLGSPVGVTDNIAAGGKYIISWNGANLYYTSNASTWTTVVYTGFSITAAAVIGDSFFFLSNSYWYYVTSSSTIPFSTPVMLGSPISTSTAVTQIKETNKIILTPNGIQYSVIDASNKTIVTKSFPVAPSTSGQSFISYSNGLYFYFPNATNNGVYYSSSDLTQWTLSTFPQAAYIAGSVGTVDGVFAFMTEGSISNKINVQRSIGVVA